MSSKILVLQPSNKILSHIVTLVHDHLTTEKAYFTEKQDLWLEHMISSPVTADFSLSREIITGELVKQDKGQILFLVLMFWSSLPAADAVWFPMGSSPTQQNSILPMIASHDWLWLAMKIKCNMEFWKNDQQMFIQHFFKMLRFNIMDIHERPPMAMTLSTGFLLGSSHMSLTNHNWKWTIRIHMEQYYPYN